MLRSTARRLALATTSTTCSVECKLGFSLASRFSSTLSGPRSDSDAVESVERLSRWENKMVITLQTYKEKHGNLLVPYNFAVPIDDESWPSVTWGHKLGVSVNGMRNSLNGHRRWKLSPNLVKELDAMEFVRDTSQFKWDAIILPSLEAFKQEFGHCLVEFSFKVPEDPKWPRAAWGFKLGIVVDAIRGRRYYVERATRDADRLALMGFAWNHKEAVWNDRIIPSLEVYSDLFKHCQVPHKFVVPSEEPWPSAARGTLRLGSVLTVVRTQGTYFAYYGRDIAKLDKLGVNLKLSARAWKKHVAPLLDICTRTSEAKEIPDDFVIPSKAPWPEEMWGVRLGLIVARNAHHLPSHLPSV